MAGEVTARGRRAMTVDDDLGDPGTPARIVAEVEDGLGGVDVLVANAGIGSAPTGILEVALEDWQRTLGGRPPPPSCSPSGPSPGCSSGVSADRAAVLGRLPTPAG